MWPLVTKALKQGEESRWSFKDLRVLARCSGPEAADRQRRHLNVGPLTTSLMDTDWSEGGPCQSVSETLQEQYIPFQGPIPQEPSLALVLTDSPANKEPNVDYRREEERWDSPIYKKMWPFPGTTEFFTGHLRKWPDALGTKCIRKKNLLLIFENPQRYSEHVRHNSQHKSSRILEVQGINITFHMQISNNHWDQHGFWLNDNFYDRTWNTQVQ